MTRRALHEPRAVCAPIGADDPATRRASRLAAAANALEEFDVKALAATYKDAGCSGIEAAAAASAALNAALQSTLMGAKAGKAAQRGVQQMAQRRVREARSEAFRAAQAEELGPAGDLHRAEVLQTMESRFAKARDFKTSLISRDVATRRAEREERICAAASRRALSEARAWIGADRRGNAERLSALVAKDIRPVPPPADLDDPTLKRARVLVNGVNQVVAELDSQNEKLRRKSQALQSLRPPSPAGTWQALQDNSRACGPSDLVDLHGIRFNAAHTSAASTHEDALLAKARELLVDYKPADAAKRHGGSHRCTPMASPKIAAKFRPQISGVLIETTSRRLRC